jgi:flavin reductase
MSRLGSAVSVVTTGSGANRYGFTASAVCSVSASPPTLLVCINRGSSCFPAFDKTSHFCVNTLMPGQEDIAELFGGRTPTDDRFALGDWEEGVTGLPVLADASVSFECELTNSVDEATHRVMFGRVVDSDYASTVSTSPKGRRPATTGLAPNTDAWVRDVAVVSFHRSCAAEHVVAFGIADQG